MVEDVSQGDSSARKSLIKQLDESSNLMSMQRDAVIHLLGQASDIEVISFYETKATPGLEKVSNRTSSFIIKIWYRLLHTELRAYYDTALVVIMYYCKVIYKSMTDLISKHILRVIPD
jgi:hypothetical protein